MSTHAKIGWGIGIIVVVVVAVILAIMPRTYHSTSVGSSMMGGYYGAQGVEDMVAPAPPSDVMNQKYASMPNTMVDSDGSVPSSGQAQERLIIKNASLSMVVDDVRTSIASISQYAESHGGFVVSSQYDKYEYGPSGSVTVRLPVDTFDTSITDVRGMGEVQSQSMSGQDVTDQYVDLDAQLKNLKATEEQFLAILKQAVKIEDILAVQRELSQVRSNIERLEGQMKYLRESAAMSTLTVYLSTDPNELPVLNEENVWKPWSVMKDAARSLVSVAQILVNAVIWIVIYIPVWLVLGVAIWYIRRRYKKATNS